MRNGLWVTMPPDLVETVRELAEKEHRTPSQQCRHLIKACIQCQGAINKSRQKEKAVNLPEGWGFINRTEGDFTTNPK